MKNFCKIAGFFVVGRGKNYHVPPTWEGKIDSLMGGKGYPDTVRNRRCQDSISGSIGRKHGNRIYSIRLNQKESNGFITKAED